MSDLNKNEKKLARGIAVAVVGFIILIISAFMLFYGEFWLIILIAGYIISAVGCGMITKWILPDNKRAFEIGLVLSIFGVLIAILMKPKKVVVTNNSSNKYEDLERLQKLKVQGIITEEEFNNEKSKLLK